MRPKCVVARLSQRPEFSSSRVKQQNSCSCTTYALVISRLLPTTSPAIKTPLASPGEPKCIGGWRVPLSLHSRHLHEFTVPADATAVAQQQPRDIQLAQPVEYHARHGKRAQTSFRLRVLNQENERTHKRTETRS